MKLTEIFQELGRERFDELLRLVSMGSLKTYKIYEGFKIRTRLTKLNRDRLRSAAPRLWERVEQGDEDLAREIAQGILVSRLDFVTQALDFLEIPHDGNGFYDKDAKSDDYLKEGWRERLLERFRDEQPEALALFYINHLAWELEEPAGVFTG